MSREMANMWKVFRGVAGKETKEKGWLYLDFLIATPFENVAVDHAKNCPSPLRGPEYIQAMIVIGPDGQTATFDCIYKE